MKKYLLLLLCTFLFSTLSAQRHLPQRATYNYEGAIHERPEGDVHYYTRTGNAWTVVAGGTLIAEASQDGLFMEVVFAKDGKNVYLKDPVSQQRYDSYVKGTLSEDGKTITVPFGQVLAYYPAYKLQILFGHVQMSGYESHLTGEAVVDQDVIYSIDANGVIRLASGGVYQPSGAIYSDDYLWLGYGDYYSTYTPTSGSPVVAPEGLATEPYRIEANGEGHTIQVGFADGEVYMQGLSTTHPEGWVRGTMEGNTVTFFPQYIGNTTSSTIFFLPGEKVEAPEDGQEYMENSLWEKTESVSFTYDAEAKAFTTDGTFFIATAATTPFYLEAYEKPVISYYPDKAVRPQNPVFVSYADPYLDQFGYFDVHFALADTDTEGNPLDHEKLFYRIYLDDEQMLFYKDDYSFIPEKVMEEINYDFTEGFDFMGPGYLSIYAHGVDKVGCQLVYYGGGQASVSDIVNYEIATKQVTVTPVNDNDGIGSISSRPMAAGIYDLLGRKASLSRGIMISNGRKSILR